MNAFFEISRDHNQQIYCELAENNSCNSHFHSNIEIVYLLEGEMQITINDRTHTLTRGCAAISGSYDIHSYKTMGSSKAWILILPIDSLKTFDNIFAKKRFNESFLDSGLYSRELESAIAHLKKYDETQPNVTAMGYMYVVLGIFIEHLGLSEHSLDSGPSELIRKILIYMDRHYLEKLTVETIAQKYGYGKTYISRMFNSQLGCGFSHYLNVLRSRHAAGLIRTTRENLDQIAYMSGFQSIRTFNRAFLDFYGMSPYEYRKKENYSTDADKEYLKYKNITGE